MKQRRRTVLGLALLGTMSPLLKAASLAGPAAGATADAGNSALDRELAAIAADPACELASLSVLAIRNGEVAYEQQFGQRFIGTGSLPSKPANAQTQYRIASISKMMTTLGLMMLVEQGKVSLDADAGDYLGFPLRNPHFPDRAVTLRTMLSHTSSLRDDGGYSFPFSTPLSSIVVPGAANYGAGQMWASNAGPGQYFTYCNLNWGLIGTLMERVTGERFDRLMKRLLLDPMGLHGGYGLMGHTAEDLANTATLYRKRTVDTEVWDAAGPWIPQTDDFSMRSPQAPAGITTYVPGTNATPFSPTGGLHISAHDLGIIMLMLMNDGMHQGRQILKPETIATMFERQWTYNGANGKTAGDGDGDTARGLLNSWALGNQYFPDADGIRLVEGGGFTASGHYGDAYGLRALFLFDKASKNGMITLVGGTSAPPEAQKGKYSAKPRFEERILTALYHRAIAGKNP